MKTTPTLGHDRSAHAGSSRGTSRRYWTPLRQANGKCICFRTRNTGWSKKRVASRSPSGLLSGHVMRHWTACCAGDRLTVSRSIHSPLPPPRLPTRRACRHSGGRRSISRKRRLSQGVLSDDTIEPKPAELLPQLFLGLPRTCWNIWLAAGSCCPPTFSAYVWRSRNSSWKAGPRTRSMSVGPSSFPRQLRWVLQERGRFSVRCWAASDLPPLQCRAPCALRRYYRANTEARMTGKRWNSVMPFGVPSKPHCGQALHACPPVPRLNLKIGNLLDLRKPALDVLAVAVGTNWPSAQTTCFSTISWTSRDCFEEAGLARWNKRSGNGSANVTILGTAGLLERLSSRTASSAERASDFQWKMFRQGYRGSSSEARYAGSCSTFRYDDNFHSLPISRRRPEPSGYLRSRPGPGQYARVSFCAPPS